ncbi:MAG: hypothetical protein AAGJ46_08550 [Planctomycetota bacterium]
MLVLAPADSRAQVTFTDDFEDLDRDNDGITDDGNETAVAEPGGINWYAINGLTSGTTPRQKPGLTTADDTAGIGTGNALFVEAIGSNGEFIGVLPETVELGEGLGSTVVTSFDFRVGALLPFSGELRFGLYQDTDNQFGTASTNTDGSPTIWGQTDGQFDRDNPGALGDLGMFTRVQIGVDTNLDGSQTRIADELNANNIAGGSGDSDLIRRANAGEFGVVNDFQNRPYRFEIEFLRAPPTDSGETIQTTLRMIDPDDNVSTLTGQQPASTDDTPTLDAIDYFVMLSTVDVDYVFDNFSIVSTPVEPLVGDYNGDGTVDAADYTVWRDGNSPDSTVAGFTAWADNFGATSGAAAGSVPEPGAAALVTLAAAAGWRRRRG